jgi:hypothetical protein
MIAGLRAWAARSLSTGFALATLLLVAGLQQLLIQDLAQRTTSNAQDYYRDMALLLSSVWGVAKLLVITPAIVFRVLQRVRAYYVTLLLAMIIITIELLANVVLLVADPVVNSWQNGYFLLSDNILLILINVNVFALWYYVLEGPIWRVSAVTGEQQWDFLFPQRAAHIAGYEDWTPRFVDYWFLALVTIFTFGPADTLPLSRRAKLFMALEIVVSVLTLTVLLGRALAS